MMMARQRDQVPQLPPLLAIETRSRLAGLARARAELRARLMWIAPRSLRRSALEREIELITREMLAAEVSLTSAAKKGKPS